LVYIVSAFVEN